MVSNSTDVCSKHPALVSAPAWSSIPKERCPAFAWLLPDAGIPSKFARDIESGILGWYTKSMPVNVSVSAYLLVQVVASQAEA